MYENDDENMVIFIDGNSFGWKKLTKSVSSSTISQKLFIITIK